MTTITISSTPDPCGRKRRKVQHVLALPGSPMPRRYGITFIPEGATGRQVYGGPMVPGPWAATFQLGLTLAAGGLGTAAERRRRLAEGTESDVAEGDLIVIDGVTFRVTVYAHSNCESQLGLEKINP